MKNTEQKLYTIDDVANIIKVHRDTVKSWVRNNKIGHIEIGYRTIRISNKHIEEFIKNREQKV